MNLHFSHNFMRAPKKGRPKGLPHMCPWPLGLR
jgi:hypothetical protein